jgi:hypothetical protein
LNGVHDVVDSPTRRDEVVNDEILFGIYVSFQHFAFAHVMEVGGILDLTNTEKRHLKFVAQDECHRSSAHPAERDGVVSMLYLKYPRSSKSFLDGAREDVGIEDGTKIHGRNGHVLFSSVRCRLDRVGHACLEGMRRERQLDAANPTPRIVLLDQRDQSLTGRDGQFLTRHRGALHVLEEVVHANLLEQEATTVQNVFALTDQMVLNGQVLVGERATMAVTRSEDPEVTLTIHDQDSVELGHWSLSIPRNGTRVWETLLERNDESPWYNHR